MSIRHIPCFVVVSAPSCTGKGVVIDGAFKRDPTRFRLCISATTKHPRPGEVAGVNYFYYSEREFMRMVRENRFLEYKQYANGDYYGTLRDQVWNPQAKRGSIPIIENDINGHLELRENPEIRNKILSIFIVPSDMRDLERRMREVRKTLSEEQIMNRLKTAEEEMSTIRQLVKSRAENVHVITNYEGKLDRTIDQFVGIIAPYLHVGALF